MEDDPLSKARQALSEIDPVSMPGKYVYLDQTAPMSVAHFSVYPGISICCDICSTDFRYRRGYSSFVHREGGSEMMDELRRSMHVLEGIRANLGSDHEIVLRGQVMKEDRRERRIDEYLHVFKRTLDFEYYQTEEGLRPAPENIVEIFALDYEANVGGVWFEDNVHFGGKGGEFKDKMLQLPNFEKVFLGLFEADLKITDKVAHDDFEGVLAYYQRHQEVLAKALREIEGG